MSNDLKALARRWFDEVWNQGSTSTIDELLADDGEMYFGDVTVTGPAAYKQFHAAYRGAFADFHMQVEDVIVEANKVFIRWTATGTHTGDLFGIPPTNLPTRFGGMSLAETRGGQLVKAWNTFEEMKMYADLKLVTLPGPAS